MDSVRKKRSLRSIAGNALTLVRALCAHVGSEQLRYWRYCRAPLPPVRSVQRLGALTLLLGAGSFIALLAFMFG